MTLFFYIANTPKNSVETLSTLDTMKIPLHREDQTKITFKTELNGSKRFYTTITKKKKKKRKKKMWMEAWNSLNFEYKGIVITNGR
jgi:hypothetical protein